MPLGNRFGPDRERPPVLPVVLRALVLGGLLITVILLRSELGQGAANCMGMFGLR